MAKQLLTITGFVLSVLTVYVRGQGLIPGIDNRCFEPVQSGGCRAFFPAFYFNPLTGACDCFVYGGCHGNNNRFATLEECTKKCSVQPNAQFNTPACDRIFRESNPLANFLASPQQVRQPVPQPTAQTQIQTQAPAQIQPQAPVQIQQAAPTQAASRPQGITVQQLQPVSHQESTDRFQEEEADEESRPPAPSGNTGTRTISSIVIGSTGVRPGSITIGQPVSIIVLQPQRIQSRTGERVSESKTDTEAQSDSENQAAPENKSDSENQAAPENQSDSENPISFASHLASESIPTGLFSGDEEFEE